MICRHCDTDVGDGLVAHLVDEHHARICVLCARRGRATQVESGHCCQTCRVRLEDGLADIVRLAADAAAWVEPRATGSAGRSVPASRPPLNVDALEPEMTLVRLQADDPTSEEPILWVLESWARVFMDERGLGRYGPWSAARGRNDMGVIPNTPRDSEPSTALTATRPDPSFGAASGGRPDHATLTGVVRFLRGQLEYATTEPTFGLEQFADEIALCRRALARYDVDRETPGTEIACPTIRDDDAACGMRLRYHDLDDVVRCPRCGATRDAATLLVIARADPAVDVWLAPDEAATWLGVSQRTLRRMARRGDIDRHRGQYRLRHAGADVDSGTG